ncbi:NAD-dependent epimerase/dehydratase family protein [Hyphomonas sp.]|uniref:NAD-dependent epimerase/dehydratase family protein n=1 Tax=Hyphomonas sp. TaxID=87 RepID=UPI003002EDD9
MLKGKKILLTGLTGQVGGAFADQLAQDNDVWGLARYSSPGSRERAEQAGVKTIIGDFAKGELDDAPDEIEIVVHVAANTKPGTAENGMLQNAEGTGLLMHKYRHVDAFIFVSASGCYLDNPDPHHRYKETDDVGGTTPFAPNYGPTKLAAEGVVRTLSRINGTPATIARLDVSYGGPYDDGGLPGHHLESIIEGRPVLLPKGRPCLHSPIHEDDMVRHLAVFARAASSPATLVNWGGPEGVLLEEWCRYIGELVGREPIFEYGAGKTLWGRITDTDYGTSLGMEWQVRWKEGMRRMVEARRPDALVS